MIAKGTLVKITTNNGGEIVATLSHNYRPSYDAFIDLPNGHWAQISILRLKSIEEVGA